MHTSNLEHESIKDERNRYFILEASSNLFTYGLHPNPRALALEGTPDERTAFVRKAKLRVLAAALTLLALVGIPWAQTVKAPIAASDPIIGTAGSVISIVLNESTFSTTTTVSTDEGVFQVKGAVTASIGNQAKVKSWSTGSVKHKALCINSDFKPDCYNLR
ncbi:hypothetical protein QAO71_17360 (plasmid) [Halopseudomonas sp. SMJS2]|uniref:hypothetical protein n=1 Tax=Halopseudomonas sp. SMJS2 TaxID=3041098 RepID=UPI0024533CB7|nr:hypothetical protein [Halopseudomonas sp. SMJS2]WGK63537.1 hypothetical protein QAO71_17360 [Halopseudomonas sp. SMJS2]